MKTDLYPREERVERSDLCFDNGVAEIGGSEKVAPLWLVQEERSKMTELGVKAYGRVREGVAVVGENYFLGNKPCRAILRKGLPLLSPKDATDANRNGQWYVPNEKYAKQVLEALQTGLIINEKLVKDNVLSMNLEDFVSDLSLFLFGGEQTEALEVRTNRVKQAGVYFRTALDKAGKTSRKTIDLYLPPASIVKAKEVAGTQLFSGSVDDGFGLSGSSRSLDYADGVFSVR